VSGATAEDVRAAIAAGDYGHALNLWHEYAARLAAGALTEESLAEAATLLAWSRPVLLGAREHAAARLRALHVAGVYGTRAVRRTALVRASL